MERKTYHTTGGAGLYTALAATACGAAVTLYAPKPQKLSAALGRLTSTLTWVGPIVEDEGDMPQLEIVHHGEDRATLLGAGWGKEAQMSPAHLDSLLQGLEPDFDIVHVAALSHPARQLDFAKYCKEKYNKASISAGTYARAIAMDKEAVLKLVSICDFFFMNANENKLLSTDLDLDLNIHLAKEQNPKIKNYRFVTDGGAGVTIFCPDASTIAAPAKHLESGPFDPTGAGDSFCGATLACLGKNHKPDSQTLLAAVQTGIESATNAIQQPGSDFYLK